MKPCPEFDVLLSERAAGALAAADVARVEAHLGACGACRAEADALAAALSAAALPPPAELERRLVADLPQTALAALRRRERRHLFATRAAFALAVACAAALVLVGPSALDGRGGAPAMPAPIAAAPAAASPATAAPVEAALAARDPEASSPRLAPRGPRERAATTLPVQPARAGDGVAASGLPRPARPALPDVEELWDTTDVLEIDGSLEL